MPRRISHLLLLIQMLIGYGKDFAATLRQQSVAWRFRPTPQARFGSSEMARILIRIGRALRLAAALQRQPGQHAATGQNSNTSAEVALAPPCLRGNRSTATASRRAAAGGTVLDNPDDGLFTGQQIETLARRGKIGAAIAAVCRDPGLVRSLVTGQQWSVLADAIITFGRNFAGSTGGVFVRVNDRILDASFTEPCRNRRSIA